MSAQDEFFAMQCAMAQATLKLAQANRDLAQAEQQLAAQQLARYTGGNLAAPSFFSSTAPAFSAPAPQKVFHQPAPLISQQAAPAPQQQPVFQEPQPVVVPQQQVSQPVAQQAPEQEQQQVTQQQPQQQQVQQQQVPQHQTQQQHHQQQNRRPQRGQRVVGAYLQAAASAPETAPPAPEPAPVSTEPAVVHKVRSNAPPSKNPAKKDAPAENSPSAPKFRHYCARTIKDELGDNIFSPNLQYTFAQVRNAGYCTFVEPIVENGPALYLCKLQHGPKGTFCQQHQEENEQRKADYEERKANREQNQQDYEARQAAREQRQAQYQERQAKRRPQQDDGEQQADGEETMNRRDRRRGQTAGVDN